MLRSGVITATEEATDWCIQLKCRWVTNFHNLNITLKRPVWGGESSYQLLRHVDPKAKFFASFDTISG